MKIILPLKDSDDFIIKLKHGCGTLKQHAFELFERNGRVYTQIIPDYKKKILQYFIRGKVFF